MSHLLTEKHIQPFTATWRLMLKARNFQKKLKLSHNSIRSAHISLLPVKEVLYLRLDASTGHIFQAWAQPDQKEKLKFRPEPGLKQSTKSWPGIDPVNFFSRFQSYDYLGLRDLKAGPFSCLHMINGFFCWWFIFLQFIKTTDFVLTAFRYSLIYYIS